MPAAPTAPLPPLAEPLLLGEEPAAAMPPLGALLEPPPLGVSVALVPHEHNKAIETPTHLSVIMRASVRRERRL